MSEHARNVSWKQKKKNSNSTFHFFFAIVNYPYFTSKDVNIKFVVNASQFINILNEKIWNRA
jgi:hypothetical protein